MKWHDLQETIGQRSNIEITRRPEFGYARIEIDLGDAEYVGTDIPLSFTGDQLAKIKYTGSNTGTYFRLNDRHAQQIYASEFKRSNIPFTKIYLTNPAAQAGKVFTFYIGTGVFAAIQPSGIGAGSELIGLTDDTGMTINPATEDKQDDIKTLQGVDGNGDLQKVKEELKKLTQSIARSNMWNVTAAVYLQNFSVAAQETSPQAIFFKPDGSKMYVLGSTGDDVNEYDLSTPWDVTAAVYLQNFSVAAQEISPTGVFFKPDGSKMYVVGYSGDDVNEYDLSTPWDVTTAVWLQLFSVAAQETSPTGVFFKPDGSKMYVVGTAGDDVNEYDLRSLNSILTDIETATEEYQEQFGVYMRELTVLMVRGLTATGTCNNPTFANDNLYAANSNFSVDDQTNIFTFTKPVLMKQFRMYGDTGGTTNVTGDGRFDIYYWDEAVNDYVLWRYDLPVRQTADWSDWEEVSLVSALKIKIVARIHDTGGVGGSAYREIEFKY